MIEREPRGEERDEQRGAGAVQIRTNRSRPVPSTPEPDTRMPGPAAGRSRSERRAGFTSFGAVTGRSWRTSRAAGDRERSRQHDHDDHEAGERPPVLAELPPEDLPRGAADDLLAGRRWRPADAVASTGSTVLCCEVALDVPWRLRHTRCSHARRIPRAAAIAAARCYGRNPQSGQAFQVRHAISAVSRGRISIPRSSPSEPSAHARSPKRRGAVGRARRPRSPGAGRDRPCAPSGRTRSSGRR